MVKTEIKTLIKGHGVHIGDSPNKEKWEEIIAECGSLEALKQAVKSDMETVLKQTLGFADVDIIEFEFDLDLDYVALEDKGV